MHYKTWFKKYRPIVEGDSLKQYETYGKDLEFINQIPETFIWTILDCDGKLYISNGKAFVNRVAYLICGLSHDDNTFISVRY